MLYQTAESAQKKISPITTDSTLKREGYVQLQRATHGSGGFYLMGQMFSGKLRKFCP
jgi:hypothetical protein